METSHDGITAISGDAVREREQAFNDYVRVALCEWLQKYGPNRDCPGKLEMFLKDGFPGCEAEVEALVCAFEMGVPGDLAWNPAGDPRPVLSEKLRNRLRASAGMALNAACWAVESWQLALDYNDRWKTA